MSKVIILGCFILLGQSLAQNMILPREDAARSYIVSVQSDFNLIAGGQNGTFRCIGTLINHNSIVTAATCVADNVGTPRNMFVAVSSTLRANPNDGVISEIFNVERIHIHPGFEVNGTANNLAVLRVIELILIMTKIQILSL